MPYRSEPPARGHAPRARRAPPSDQPGGPTSIPRDDAPQEPDPVTGLERARPCTARELQAWVDRYEQEALARDAVERIVDRVDLWVRSRIRELVRAELCDLLSAPGAARAVRERLGL